MIQSLKTGSALLTGRKNKCAFLVIIKALFLSLQPCSLAHTSHQPQLLPQYAGEYWKGKDSVSHGSVRYETMVSILHRPRGEGVSGSH